MIFKTVPVIKTSEHRSSELPGVEVYVHEVILFDMYVDGVWHGSRRTQEQADAYFEHVERVVKAKQDG